MGQVHALRFGLCRRIAQSTCRGCGWNSSCSLRVIELAMSGAPFQIVLVEDTELDVFLIRKALEQAGVLFELQVLGNGEEALEFISKIDSDKSAPLPHLIILDLNLPRVNGGQVLEGVRRSLRCASVPALVLTSSDSPKDRALVSQFTATQYFQKSSSLDEFMSLGPMIRELLERGDSSSRACAN